MRFACGFTLLLLYSTLAWGAEPSLAARQADAKQQQAELRARIQSLQKDIDAHESTRKDAANELKTSELAISVINRRLVDISAEKEKATQELHALGGQITDQKGELNQRQQELADQLRAQYASGLSPWAALLSGDDPQAIGRDLGYLGYISQAQADAVRAVHRALDKLAKLQTQSEARTKELAALAQETTEKKNLLEEQKAERLKVLARIETQLQEQRGQAQRLGRNDQRLSELVSGLDVAIAEQAEQARLAAERRRAEAARKAEAERRAAQERRQAIEREREAARKAEQAARAAQERAKREQGQAEAEKARLQVEQARAQARAAEQAEQAEQRAQAAQQASQASQARAESGTSVRGSVPGVAAEQSAAPAVSKPLAGLHKGLPMPVRGDIQGQFGAQRPEGGLWRGIVLRSPEGTAVHSVAPGTVAYANWLNGFGNIIIVDHGAKYLSVYAYNQSLLKHVGDTVATGEAIATVGATGGQVESGLYFEIRHQGTPVNPLLWLRR